jgi:hypothetical protein
MQSRKKSDAFSTTVYVPTIGLSRSRALHCGLQLAAAHVLHGIGRNIFDGPGSQRTSQICVRASVELLKADVRFRGWPLSYLALSGGGADGAYGAGVLNGWSAAGTRPEFSVVSGMSTGALIAPFAFLGPAYDATLRDVYTSGIAESLLSTPSIVRAAFGSGLFVNTHLRELVARYIDQNMLEAIAAENAKGRKLLVVTTNLVTQRTVI